MEVHRRTAELDEIDENKELCREDSKYKDFMAV